MFSKPDLGSKSAGGAQQRKSQRFKVKWPSRVLLPDRRIIAAKTRDVSSGGVGFELDESLPVGSELSIEISPWSAGKQYVIRAKCVVTYSMILSGNAGFSHGVRFSFIPPDQLAQLKQVLKALE
jgi:hypothetical protein